MTAISRREQGEAIEEVEEEGVCGAYTDPEMMAKQRRILTQEEGERLLKRLAEPPKEITPEARRALREYKRLVADWDKP